MLQHFLPSAAQSEFKLFNTFTVYVSSDDLLYSPGQKSSGAVHLLVTQIISDSFMIRWDISSGTDFPTASLLVNMAHNTGFFANVPIFYQSLG